MNLIIYLCTLLLALTSIPAYTNEEVTAGPISLAALEGEPSSIVHGCVSVITGDYVESQVDIVVPGVEPLMIQRTYSSTPLTDRSMGRGWGLNHHGYLDIDIKENNDGISKKWDETHAVMTDETGSSMMFFCKHKVSDKHTLKANQQALNFGVTNSARGVISGRTNWVNTRINYFDKSYHAKTGSGTQYVFDKKSKDSAQKDVHRLLGITKPNGCEIAYEYDKHNLEKIIQKNRLGQIISWATIDRQKSLMHNDIHIKTHDGKAVHYVFEYLRKPTLCISGTNIPDVKYTYTDSSSKARIEHKEMSDNRFRKINYYTHGKNHEGIEVVKIRSDDPRMNRVKRILEPVGKDHNPYIACELVYEIGFSYDYATRQRLTSGLTKVYDALRYQQIYHYDEDHRLTEVAKYKGQRDYTLYSREKLYWGDNTGPNKTRLVNRSLEDAQGNIIFNRHFEYDKKGNILQDVLCGNVTGKHPQPVKIDAVKGHPTDDNCKLIKTYTYTHDGMNLMQSESDGFCTTEYRYHEDTDLIRARYLIENDIIRKRTFYNYDQSGALRLQIEDDGQARDRDNLDGVTERKMTHIKNTPTGLPQVIEEKYLDLTTLTPVLLHKTVNEYGETGRLKHQSHYDQNQNFLYELSWSYHKYGSVCNHINALGQETVSTYDEHGNKVYEQGPNRDYFKVFSYDCANRLIREEIVSNNQSRFVKTYNYDHKSQLTSSSDIYGNTTSYRYDEFGRQIRTYYPDFADKNGKPVTLVVKKEYDLMGNLTDQTDACGATTKTLYTIQGKPYQIAHPDCSMESKEYGARGNLVKSTAKNGTTTYYTYDYQSRPLSKSVYDAQGKYLYETHYTYNAFHLLTETDADGNLTEYSYDNAGRLSQILKGERKTTYLYDSLGRVKETREHNGDTIIVYIKEHDLLNRVIEERVEDQNGQVFSKTAYEYDLDGNKTKISTETQAGVQVTTTRYNALKEPIEIIDAMGQRQLYEYDYKYRNSLGQFVPKCTMTDPSGNQTITIKDAMDHIASVEVKNPFGQTIQLHKNEYNSQGRKIRQIETVYMPEGKTREVITGWDYDMMGHVQEIIEAVGTTIQKHTYYKYNSVGQLETISKRDGTKIEHKYDAHERLIEQRASDGSFHYVITYDQGGSPSQIKDLISQTLTDRIYSPFGQVLEETLGNELTLKYAYDRMGRVTQLTLPDQTQVEYSYDPYRLKKVERLTANGLPLYAHIYDEYDKQGNLIEATLIGRVGKLQHKTDLLNRIVNISMRHWSETITAYDPSGNPRSIVINSLKRGQVKNDYGYNDLQQLTQEPEHAYAYDSVYNRIAKDDKHHEVNDLNELLFDGQTAYSYDANGRMEKKLGGAPTSYEYDALDRLISVTNGDKRTTYVYDFDHRRLSKTYWQRHETPTTWKKEQTIRYLYQGKNEIGSVDEQGKITQLRVLGFGHGAEIGAAVAIECGNRLYAPVHDHNGSVTCLIDAETGEMAEEYKYTSFGEEQIFDNQGELKESAENPWRYASKRLDEESGFIFFGRRYYLAEIGRWLTPDPIGLEGGPNMYAYVYNNPLSYFDLYGLIAQEMGSGAAGDFFTNAVETIFTFVGSCIRFVGDHILPIPYVRQAISEIGRAISNGQPSGQSRSSNFAYPGSGELSPNVRVMYINGVNTDDYAKNEGPGFISTLLGSINIHVSHNSCHGFILNIGECFAQKLGIPTHSVEMAVKQIKAQIEAVGGVGSGGRVIIHAHSQGGLITQRAIEKLDPGELAMLEVITYGSASMIDDKRLHYCANYVSIGDFVPLFDLWGLIKGMFSKNSKVHFINSKRPFDHSFAGDSYQSALRYECNRLIQTYGN